MELTGRRGYFLFKFLDGTFTRSFGTTGDPYSSILSIDDTSIFKADTTVATGDENNLYNIRSVEQSIGFRDQRTFPLRSGTSLSVKEGAGGRISLHKPMGEPQLEISLDFLLMVGYKGLFGLRSRT